MDAVGVGGERDIDAVVDDEAGSRRPRDRDERPRLLDQRPRLRLRIAELDHRRAAGDRRRTVSTTPRAPAERAVGDEIDGEVEAARLMRSRLMRIRRVPRERLGVHAHRAHRRVSAGQMAGAAAALAASAPAAPIDRERDAAASSGGAHGGEGPGVALRAQPSAVESGISASPPSTATTRAAVGRVVGLAGDGDDGAGLSRERARRRRARRRSSRSNRRPCRRRRRRRQGS